jgi:hypothetical protein
MWLRTLVQKCEEQEEREGWRRTGWVRWMGGWPERVDRHKR